MNGKPSLRKKLKKLERRPPANYRSTYTQIGSWQIREDTDGSLVILNFETNQRIILARKEWSEDEPSEEREISGS